MANRHGEPEPCRHLSSGPTGAGGRADRPSLRPPINVCFVTCQAGYKFKQRLKVVGPRVPRRTEALLAAKGPIAPSRDSKKVTAFCLADGSIRAGQRPSGLNPIRTT